MKLLYTNLKTRPQLTKQICMLSMLIAVLLLKLLIFHIFLASGIGRFNSPVLHSARAQQ